jgi:hypothetical protein
MSDPVATAQADAVAVENKVLAFVRANAVKASGISLVVGFLVGLIF